MIIQNISVGHFKLNGQLGEIMFRISTCQLRALLLHSSLELKTAATSSDDCLIYAAQELSNV